jgi:2-polyprenyl-6-methoxyphenol hydroxylase-like FAD-dependent oxidoreductase
MAAGGEVLIIGAGVAGLTTALSLAQAGVACRVFEAAPEILPLGVGINLLPHATRELDELGLLAALEARAVATREAAFFNRHGQRVYAEPLGRFSGYDWPQLSIHRGDLQMTLLEAARTRLGADRIATGRRCVGVQSDADGVVARFTDADGRCLPDERGSLLIACDGIHSAIRKQFHPDEGPPRYSGVNMWRGAVIGKPFLSGATMVRAGWLSVGKMVIYPIRNLPDGTQLINWVAEVEAPAPVRRDWNRPGRLEDFFPVFADWHFEWLDVAAMIRATPGILEYPMVDQDPLARWTFGRATLLGDAAHPMVPRGSNGAGQAIVDARVLAGRIKALGTVPAALEAYEAERNPATAKVVLMNRSNPPDAILRVEHERTGGKPFGRIEDVIAHAEMAEITARYKSVAGYDVEELRARPPYL